MVPTTTVNEYVEAAMKDECALAAMKVEYIIGRLKIGRMRGLGRRLSNF